MKDERRAIDTLVRDVVRRLLFPDLRKTPQWTPSPPRVKLNEPSTSTSINQQDSKDATVLPFDANSRYAHVLSYASWSDTQLQDERRRLCKFLQNTSSDRPEEETVEVETDETMALEALALLELFQRERQSPDQVDVSPRLMHAQLALFVRYFEKYHNRKILHDIDLFSIQKSYEQWIVANQE